MKNSTTNQMKNSTTPIRKALHVFTSMLCILAIALCMASSSYAMADHGTKLVENALVFMANGEHSPDEPQTLLETSFFTDVMNWDQYELDEFKQETIAGVEARFGIDTSNAADFMVLVGTTNPLINYRAYYRVGSVEVGKRGWPVREGVIAAVVVNPNGVDLGGEFEGTTAAPGTIMGGGIYNIQVLKKNGKPSGKEIIIPFISSAPIVTTPFGQLSFFCQLHHEKWGVGLAQGISNPKTLENGNIKQNVRNVLTFSELGGP